MFVVGLSGGIGSGKSTIGKLFQKQGIEVIDADDLAKAVVAKGSAGLAAIVNHFDETILQQNGELDRAKLRTVIFKNPEQKQWLEGLIHPLIHQATQNFIASATSPYVIYISPLLVEKGIPKWVSSVLIIDCAEDVQIQRTMTRDNNSEALVRAIMANQVSRDERLAAADDIIENNGEEDSLELKVQLLHKHYLSQVTT